jgi:hypothetical protein
MFDLEWADHPLYFRAPRQDGKRGWVNVALVAQPYGWGRGVQQGVA